MLLGQHCRGRLDVRTDPGAGVRGAGELAGAGRERRGLVRPRRERGALTLVDALGLHDPVDLPGRAAVG